MSEKWKTAITNIEPNKVQLRGYSIDALMGKVSFAQVVYLAIMGKMPDENVGKIIDMILVSSVDHGVTPPSALAARTVASTGASLNAALSAGILSINRWHGGAIEDSMRVYAEVVEKAEQENIGITESAEIIVSEYKLRKEKIKGFGHRIHNKDPRQIKLYESAKKLGIAGKYVEASEAIREIFLKNGKNLPINVDGAIGAILCEIGFPPVLANAFFMIARMPGLTAHIYEEWQREKPMRRIEPSAWEYDGETDQQI